MSLLQIPVHFQAHASNDMKEGVHMCRPGTSFQLLALLLSAQRRLLRLPDYQTASAPGGNRGGLAGQDTALLTPARHLNLVKLCLCKMQAA